MKTVSTARILTIVLALFAVIGAALAESVPIEKTLGGVGRDMALTIESTNDGGYIIG